jgi:hypothetical protein
MSAPPSTYQSNLSRREEIAVSGAALSEAPWKLAGAGAGSLVRSRHSRALRWARSRPWRFAALPGAAAAILVFVLTVLDGSGLLGSAFTAVWHGAIAFAVTGVVGSVVRPRRQLRG